MPQSAEPFSKGGRKGAGSKPERPTGAKASQRALEAHYGTPPAGGVFSLHRPDTGTAMAIHFSETRTWREVAFAA